MARRLAGQPQLAVYTLFGDCCPVAETIGGTPLEARETRALPQTHCIFLAWALSSKLP